MTSHARKVAAARSAGVSPGVLIVDDSAVARAVMVRALQAAGNLSVAAALADAGSALRYLAGHRVAAIVLDLEMPGIDGFTALPELIAAGRGAPVLVVSSACAAGARATLRALSLGAADTLVKPGACRFGGEFGTELASRLERLIDDASGRHAPPRPARSPYELIAIGASTGGIHALSPILAALDAELTLPIVVTQHLPESFMSYFATQLSVLARRPCAVAHDGARLEPGRILVAPGDAHIRLVKTADGAAIRLSQEKVASGCRPSVDPMLDSAAQVFGPQLLAIVLSGMGRDGLDGARQVARTGGSVVVQDEESSVVWGMPGAIAGAGVADAILPPAAIGRLIASRRRPC